LDEEDPWSGILAAVMFATRATYHTTTQATPAQLVFGRDAILNTKFEADWKYIRARKQQLIDQNNFNENKKRISHQYKVGDKVLYRIDSMSKFNDNPYEGPYQIVHVYTNGTVWLKMGAVTDTVNIRLIKPYRD
jgi:protein associated with RNAse G/E